MISTFGLRFFPFDQFSYAHKGRQELSMTKKRKLTGEEKGKIIDEARTSERTAKPRAKVKVVVEDETDDAGEPVVRIERQ